MKKKLTTHDIVLAIATYGRLLDLEQIATIALEVLKQIYSGEIK